MQNPYWYYFISLEKEFIDSIQYVELDPSNDASYSIFYAKMLFSTCAEIEVVLKALCAKASPSTKVNNIDDYRNAVLLLYPKFHEIEIQIPRYSRSLKPWDTWSRPFITKEKNNPFWWYAYTGVKHNRATEFREANQKNVLNALAALFAALIFFYQKEIDRGEIDTEPLLFEYPTMFPSHLVCEHKLQLSV
jgi:hypothetical protein